MRDCGRRIAQYLSEGYAELESDYEDVDKLMIVLTEKLIADGIIEPGRFFRYIRSNNGTSS